MIDIAWITAFLDRPATTFEVTQRFWSALTGSTVSARRGDRDHFATLLPPTGDPYLRLQQVLDGLGGCHLDLHVRDVPSATDSVLALGGSLVSGEPGLSVLSDPNGFPFCLVDDSGERTRPKPLRWPGGQTSLVDQLCLDAPAPAYDTTIDFWSTLTGWPVRPSSVSTDFCSLLRPPGMPLRLLLQRTLDSVDTPRVTATRAHLDLACDDVSAEVSRHLALGGTVVRERPAWTTLRDPGGFDYCVTRRDPVTGTV